MGFEFKYGEAVLRYTKEFYRFIKHVFNSRELLFTLIKNDFKKQYLGSYLGLVWAFAQPLSFIVVIWFAFEVGLRAGAQSDGTPFFLFLVSGMIPWFFIANSLTSATNAVSTNAFLVKKVAFRVSILPLVQIGSSLMVHLVLVGILMLVFILYGYYPSQYWLQIPFYILCGTLMLLGITWMTSAINVFIKDMGNLITVLTQIGFWATPILWNIEMIPQKYLWIVQLNPAVFIVEGFRNSFYKEIWFWQQPQPLLYYMLTCLFFLSAGALVFKRLRPHFGDVI